MAQPTFLCYSVLKTCASANISDDRGSDSQMFLGISQVSAKFHGPT